MAKEDLVAFEEKFKTKIDNGMDWSFPRVVDLLLLYWFFKVYLVTFSPY